jgi:hypothetical protein
MEHTVGEPRPRRAIPADAEQVASLWLRSRRASVPLIPPPVHTDDEVISWFATVVLQQQARPGWSRYVEP